MTDKERMIEGLKRNGFEVTVTVSTVQWTNPNWTTIAWFDENGQFVKTTRS